MAYLDAVREYMAQYEDDVKEYFDGLPRQAGLAQSFYKTFVDEYVATMDYPIGDKEQADALMVVHEMVRRWRYEWRQR